MAGSEGDGAGTVYLAHVWVPREHWRHTVGPWEWWNVYKSEEVAARQAVQQATGGTWKGYARWEVLTISGETFTQNRIVSLLRDRE